MRRRWITYRIIPTAIVLTAAASTTQVSGLTYNRGLYGRCTYNACSITISSSANLSINVLPTASGQCSVQKDTVTVTTASSTGYALSLVSSNTSANLSSGGATIPASSAVQATPNTLATNTWGYRVDGVGGFGAGPTSAQTNASSLTVTFAGVPASGNGGVTIASTLTAASGGATTPVWYGVCVNTATTSGTYQSQVTYTAVVN